MMDKDDFIQVIFGCYTQLQITQFGVVTYKGKQVIFGEDCGQKYKYLSLGYSFTSAFGTIENGSLKMLGFWKQKLPKEDVLIYCNSLLDNLYNNLEQQQYYQTNYTTSYVNQNDSNVVQTAYDQSNYFQDENYYDRSKNKNQTQNSMQKKLIKNNKQEEIRVENSPTIIIKDEKPARSPFKFKDMSNENHRNHPHPHQENNQRDQAHHHLLYNHLLHPINHSQGRANEVKKQPHLNNIKHNNNHSKPTNNSNQKHHHSSHSTNHSSQSNHHSSRSNHHSSSNNNNGGGGGGHHHH